MNKVETYNRKNILSQIKWLIKMVRYLLKKESSGGDIENIPDVSATERGVVNNEPLQELGGADKLINGVRVGTGSAENSDTNIVLGKNSLDGEDNESGNNVAVGNHILNKIVNGENNVGVGNYVLTNSLGNSNTAIGYASSYRLGDGDFNTTVGAWSGDGTEGIPPTGERNTFIGAVAAPFIESGSNNVAIGYRSGNAIRTGNHNIMIGIQSGDKTTSTLPPNATWDFGDRNIFIGRLAGVWTVPNLAEDYLVIHSYNNESGEDKTPLILGHFTDRFFRVGGVLELDPQFLPAPDATFTKKLVYNPTDGKVTAVDDTSGSGIQSIVPGDNISVDNTDPQNPVVSSTGGNLTLEQARQNWNVLSGDIEFDSGYHRISQQSELSGEVWIDFSSTNRTIGIGSSWDYISKLTVSEDNISIYGQKKGLLGTDEFDKQGDRKAFAQIADVEDFYKTIPGYDEEVTQTLKHVNGVLQWVIDK